MSRPLALLNDLQDLQEVSILIAASDRLALPAVDRMGIFLAEALVVLRREAADYALAVDILGHDPYVENWLDGLRCRSKVSEVFRQLEPPFCLVAWKKGADDKFSSVEMENLRRELERASGAVVYHLSGA
ncbi:hypothetical protein BH09VER1_BH09VER1_47610 [soil metagenome]